LELVTEVVAVAQQSVRLQVLAGRVILAAVVAAAADCRQTLLAQMLLVALEATATSSSSQCKENQ
jgi:uncharacterized membrane protein